MKEELSIHRWEMRIEKKSKFQIPIRFEKYIHFSPKIHQLASETWPEGPPGFTHEEHITEEIPRWNVGRRNA